MASGHANGRINGQRRLTISLLAGLALGGVGARPAAAQLVPSAGVIFENVRIFNGTSDRRSAPSNVLVVGNLIQSISTAAIADDATTVRKRAREQLALGASQLKLIGAEDEGQTNQLFHQGFLATASATS